MFNNEKNLDYIIKGQKRKRIEVDFALNPISYLMFSLFFATGFFFFYFSGNIAPFFDLLILLCFSGVLISILVFLQVWVAIIDISIGTVLLLFWWKGFDSLYFSTFFVLGGIMATMIQIAKEWERAIVLRFGKFRKVKGPGVFFLIPFIDRVDKVVDLRTRVTDFVAETTLTKDSVTVTVDALCFWLVWDAEKAVCEVENYIEAVVLSSQTALRSAISKNDLSTLLENGEQIENMVREEVDKKTTEWGITVSHIEITDIQIPEHLQDSMSKLAQAEREKKSRILFGEAELELAKKFSEASVYYKDNEVALKLRAMNILNEGLKNGNSMIIPSNLMEEMKNIDMFGLKALDEINKIKRE